MDAILGKYNVNAGGRVANPPLLPYFSLKMLLVSRKTGY
jgi:hypothetical protein